MAILFLVTFLILAISNIYFLVGHIKHATEYKDIINTANIVLEFDCSDEEIQEICLYRKKFKKLYILSICLASIQVILFIVNIVFAIFWFIQI